MLKMLKPDMPKNWKQDPSEYKKMKACYLVINQEASAGDSILPIRKDGEKLNYILAMDLRMKPLDLWILRTLQRIGNKYKEESYVVIGIKHVSNKEFDTLNKKNFVKTKSDFDRSKILASYRKDSF